MSLRSGMLSLALGAVLAGCATLSPPGSVRLPYNESSVSFVAQATPERVLDAVEAGFRSRDCLVPTRGRDTLGVEGLDVEDACEDRFNVARLRLTEAGPGRVRGTADRAFRMGPVYEDLGLMMVTLLFESRIPAYIEPVPEAGHTPCLTVDAGLERAAEWLDNPPDTTATPDEGIDEVIPEIVGGFDAFQRTIQYPDDARYVGAQGRSMVQFVADESGAVTCAELAVSLHPALDAEALRAVRAARFTPGTQDGVPVKVRFTLPVTFRIR